MGETGGGGAAAGRGRDRAGERRRAEEEVVDELDVARLLGRRAVLVEEAHQVAKLAVDVAKDLDGR